MRKVIVNEFLSLDGVAQAPGAADEDPSGGFAHGGWHMKYMEDELGHRWVLESIVEAGGLPARASHLRDLRGVLAERARRGAGDRRAAERQAEARRLDDSDRAARVAELDPARGRGGRGSAALKQAEGGHLHVIGSTELVRTLIEHDLVDEFRLMIGPVLLGGGKRIFRDDGLLRQLRLVDGQVTGTGAILATYAPA